ncbi:hypothetical protein [Arthrobacter sp. Br18]|uniref:hypothetical protein n=1 Tax=Arthrobacter sp. Br18 TaxID=1312954 RepID=UPI0012DD0BEC|nr:hypothetical protein [Arthrobacter sp. Br18]
MVTIHHNKVMVTISALREEHGRTRPGTARTIHQQKEQQPVEEQQPPSDRPVGATATYLDGDTEHFRQPPGGPSAGARTTVRDKQKLQCCGQSYSHFFQ